MATLTLPQALGRAAWAYQAGAVAEAESLCRQIVAADPNFLLLQFSRSVPLAADTAALKENLDLVILVDTCLAHLAGALDRPAWVLLSFTHDWRWLLDRQDSPWYPTAQLFRQDAARRWETVIETVRDALADFVRSHSQRIA